MTGRRISRRRISLDDANAVVAFLRRTATLAHDPADAPAIRSVDPGDDYLLALAASVTAVLVSGDDHLVALQGAAPVDTPAGFLDLLDRTGS